MKKNKYEKIKRVFWFFTGKMWETGEFEIIRFYGRTYIFPIVCKRKWLWLVKEQSRKRVYAINYHKDML